MLVNLLSIDTRFIKHSFREKGRVTKRGRDRRKKKKIARKKERLRQAEKIHLDEICSSNFCSLVDGEGRKMINENEGV